MKIIITVEDFDPDKGYLEYYLAKELANVNHEIIIVTYSLDKIFSRKKLDKNFDVVYIPYIFRLNGFHLPCMRSVIYIINLIKAERPEVIHCQPLFSPLSLIFIIWKNLYGYKIVGSILTQLPTHWGIIKKVLFCFTKLIIDLVEKKLDAVFVKTKELRELILQSYNIPSHKFCVIPLGADKMLFKFDPKARTLMRKELNLSETDVVIVYSGKIILSKDIDILIKAIAPIITQNYKVKLLIIGKGEPYYVNHLKSLINDLKISNNVIFYPWIHRTKLPAFYSASDIAVWPGLSSISIIEAASTGLPLIIARYPVEIYAIEYGNGYAFKRGDMNELRKYLEILIYNDKLRKEMGNKSKFLVEQKLNWKNIALLYLNRYRDVLNLSKDTKMDYALV